MALRWLLLAAGVLLAANLGWILWRGLQPPRHDVGMPAPVATQAAGATRVPPAPVPGPRVERAPQATPAPVTPPPVRVPPVQDGAALPTGLLVPVQGVRGSDLVDTYGDARGSERRHEALDIMAPAGTPVLAVADGHVEKLFSSERGGLTVYQFDRSGTWCYYYAHLQAYAPGLAEGQALRRGALLGYVGSSGNADPAAPHLHFALFRLTPERQWWNATPVNPYPLLAAAPAPR